MHTHVAGVHTHIPGVGCPEEHSQHGHAHGHHHNHVTTHEAAVRTDSGSERLPLLGSERSDIGDLRTAFMALSLQTVISVHALFEGLGLGAERRLSEVVSILLAIVVHKVSECFLCLSAEPAGIRVTPAVCGPQGVESFIIASAYLRSTMSRRLTVGLMVLFALTSPLGIAIGIVISTKNESVAVLRGLLVSVAAGTFLYVGTLILKDQDHVGDCLPIAKANSFLRFVLWCAGFVLMCLVALWEH